MKPPSTYAQYLAGLFAAFIGGLSAPHAYHKLRYGWTPNWLAIGVQFAIVAIIATSIIRWRHHRSP